MFCDFLEPDQEDLGTHTLWGIEAALKEAGIDVPVEDWGTAGYAPIVRGFTLECANFIRSLIDEAESETRRLVEAGEF